MSVSKQRTRYHIWHARRGTLRRRTTTSTVVRRRAAARLGPQWCVGCPLLPIVLIICSCACCCGYRCYSGKGGCAKSEPDSLPEEGEEGACCSGESGNCEPAHGCADAVSHVRLRDIVLPHILAHREHFALALASELMDKHICAFLVSLFGERD